MLRKLAVLFLLLLATVSPTSAETQPPDPPHTVYLPLVGRNFYTGEPPLLIAALYYDTYITGEPDEAFQIYNPLPVTVSLAGWKVTAGTRTVTFPPGITLNANAKLWCARKATDFRQTFGVSPGCEYGGDSDPAVPDLTGTAPTFTNTGGRVTLSSPNGSYADVLVYEAGDTGAPGWHGSAVFPYKPSNNFGEEGQVLYRKLDQRTGLPVPDTDTRADWAQDPDDLINGRKAQYPGWELERFFVPRVVTERGNPVGLCLRRTTPLRQSRRFWRAPAPASASRATRSRMPAWARSSPRGRAPGYAVEMLLEGSPAGRCQRPAALGRAADRAGGRTHLLSPIQLSRRHPRPLHLSARQVLGAGWRHRR